MNTGARSPRRSRRWVRAGFAVLAAFSAAAVGAAGAANADPSPSPAGSALPLRVTLDRLTPHAPQPGGTVQIVATVANVSSGTVSGMQAQLLLSRTKVGFRGAFDDYADVPDGEPPSDATAVTTASVQLPRPALDEGTQEKLTITADVDDLQLPQAWQVYELAVVVTGELTTVPVGAPVAVGRLRTFLPYAPVDANGVGLPTRVAWVWPLVDRPHRTDDTTWNDDDLATAVAPDGRLTALVAAAAVAGRQHRPPPKPVRTSKRHRHRTPPPPPQPPQPPLNPVPVTWAIDPMLLDDATLMAKGYQVGTGDDQHAGAGRSAATRWLATLTAATRTGRVLALPYADPDITAAVRSQLVNEVQLAERTGQVIVTRVLGGSPLTYAWPPDGAIDQRALDAEFASGVTTVVLDSTALPVAGGPSSETPSAHAQVPVRDAPGGSLPALLVDHDLNAAVAAGADDPSLAPMEVQRILSELLMIQAERPSDQRDVVLAPGRRWDPPASYAAALLSGTGRVPWVAPVTLDQVAAGPVYDKVERQPLDYPAAERALQLRRGYLGRVAGLKHEVDAFAGILPAGDAQARAFDSGILRLLSSAWRTQPGTALAQFDALEHDVTTTMGKVRIASRGGLVTLTSHSGTVPVTVANDLDTPVRVIVDIQPDPRLVIRGGRVVRTIQAGRRVPVDVRATAQTSGVFKITVSLLTPSGQRYGAPVVLSVRSTAYGITALLITGAATGALFAAVLIRLIRRARTARRSARAQA